MGANTMSHLGIELKIYGEVVRGSRCRPLIDQLSDQGSALHHRHLSKERNHLREEIDAYRREAGMWSPLTDKVTKARTEGGQHLLSRLLQKAGK